MANYVGAECPVCGKEFSGDDDIVVCPICGTPHHRACYRQIGKCAKDELHSQGHSWEPPRQEPKREADAPSGSGEKQTARKCPACGANNPPDSIFCLTCGVRLEEPGVSSSCNAASSAYTAAFGGVSPGEEIAGVSARDLALYVGTGSHYFLPRFRMLAQGRPFDFNAPALLNFVYFFYRKMYLVGFALLGLFAFAQIPYFLISSEMTGFIAQHFKEIFINMDTNVINSFVPEQHPLAMALYPYLRLLPYMASILLSLFGNRIYLNSAVYNIRKIRQLCEKAPGGFDDRIYTEMLARRGRTSFGIVIAVLVAIIAAYMMIFSSFMMPYMDTILNALG